MKILMVCLGNICRSPLAEGILRHKISDEITVESAGTGNWHVGQSPDRRSIKIAQDFGVDISKQCAQHFTVEMFDRFDLIFAMDRINYFDIIKLAKNDTDKSKVKLLLKEAFGEEKDVPDPYYGDEKHFLEVYQLLDKATDQIIAKYELK